MDKTDIDTAIEYINESASAKLNITGGGEPFLKYGNVLRLVEAVRVPSVEIVTAGYWAKTQSRAASVLDTITAARRRNPFLRELRLRLSLDRFHVGAPRPVPLAYYANVIRAWAEADADLGLGFRGIQPDQGTLDRQLADMVGGHIDIIDDWNRRLVLPDDSSIPITFNVMRFSGKAAEFAEDVDLRSGTKTIKQYYEPFEIERDRLNLATTINDAINRTYTYHDGAAVTLNSDGTLWIFCGTAPDRKLVLGQTDFATSMAHFFHDPITRFLAEDGVWALADMVAELDEGAHDAALDKNDMAFLVEDLLAADDARLAVTLCVTNRMWNRREIQIREDLVPTEILAEPEAELLALCCGAMAERRLSAC